MSKPNRKPTKAPSILSHPIPPRPMHGDELGVTWILAVPKISTVSDVADVLDDDFGKLLSAAASILELEVKGTKHAKRLEGMVRILIDLGTFADAIALALRGKGFPAFRKTENGGDLRTLASLLDVAHELKDDDDFPSEILARLLARGVHEGWWQGEMPRAAGVHRAGLAQVLP
jgi:hypothetical protein